VPGGEQAVLLAIREVVGPEGTIVAPAQSWHLADPAYLKDPAVPEEWWPRIRDELPAYDPETTPSRAMGLIAEALRTHPGSLRSAHPHRSFSAWGPAAAAVVARHDLDDPVGEGSPLAALYEMDADILLLGVGYEACTALHLAEVRSGREQGRVQNGAPMLIDGERHWVEFTEPVVKEYDFPIIGTALEQEPGAVSVGRVGPAESRLVHMRRLVDDASTWMQRNRT
jgi:aminoglycoside 3-N-acetyltransferase